ncbi:zinc finger protein 260-like isoform X3 [Thalassophryne amazonica]|uniref:zinc finger protein 260-like isoform X3 n=1 Tax=Thalassophryne amazonica TaxID=390379 RepID=UPI0014708DDA|nr:zinc finger protein 260-like isoform X3 [Thalassophryne amazonica]
MLQQLVIKEEMLPEQQELNLSVDRKDIKLKQEEVWTSNKGQQLHRLETEKTKLHFVPVKTENDDEIPQSSQVLQNSDMLQQLVIKEEMLPEQQELNLSVDQKDIKQEQEEVWTSNEGQQLHRLETEKTKFLFVPVKTENDDEIPQSSQVLQNSDMQTLLVMKEEIIPEQQERNLTVDQEDIKEEQEKLWIHPQVLQLYQPEEADITKCPFSAVKSDNDEKPQSSQVHQSQSDESTEADPVASSSPVLRTLTAQAGGEDDGGPQSASCSRLPPDTNGRSSETDSYKWKQTKQFSSGFNSLINSSVSVTHSRCNMKKKKYNGSENVKACGHMNYLKQEKRRQRSEKPFSCFECGENFEKKGHVIAPIRINTEQKPFSCSECGKTFEKKRSLVTHMRRHTGQKPFSCSECGKRFGDKSSLVIHMRIHTGQKPFSCSECGKRFGDKSNLFKHMRIHTRQKPFSCSECGKRFRQKSTLITHMIIHTGQKQFSCSECGKRFGLKGNLLTHMRIHTRQKPFPCSECGKTFGHKNSLIAHMTVHTGQKPFPCSECGKRFVQKSNVIRHMRIHTGQFRNERSVIDQ